MTAPRIGIVVGLEAEARLARPWGLPVAVGGGTAAGAMQAAEHLAGTVDALVSFGLAGGLDPSLAPGALLVPQLVMDEGTWTTDPALNTALGGSTGHVLLGGGTVLATTSQKRAAFEAGAHAVDLESGAVARVAARLGLPFAVLRAVCDAADRALPQAAMVALDARGRIGGLHVLAAALSNPRELSGLFALARDAGLARRALRRRVSETPLKE